MGDSTKTMTYFEEPGPQNTATTLSAARERAAALGISHVVVASDTGKTARAVMEVFKPPLQVVVITNVEGMSQPLSLLYDYLPQFRAHKEKLSRQGIGEVPCAFSATVARELAQAGAWVSRVDWDELQCFVGADLSAIDIIGVGTRAALCCTVWAYLAKLLPPRKEVLALAGTGFGGGGADTALVVRTGAIWKEWRILETIVKPRESPPSKLIS
jgi:uncharacterized protein